MPPASAHQVCRELLRAAVHGDPPPPLHATERTWETVAHWIQAQHLAVVLGAPAQAAGMPGHLAAPMEEEAQRDRRRLAVLLLELRQALEVLEDAGATPLVLKGAALAQGQPRPRYFSDLDVLVPRASLAGATRALERLQYSPPAAAKDRAFYERHHFHSVLRSPRGITLELHWALGRPSDYFSLDPADVLARAHTVPFDGMVMRVPADGDHLLHAAAQSLRDGFSAARRVLDVARILRKDGLEVAELPARAGAARLQSALWILLRLSDVLTDVSHPSLEASLAPSPLRRACFRALDLPQVPTQQLELTQAGLRRWLLLLCAPDARTTLAAFLAATFPGERGLLEDGHRADALPGRWSRGVLAGKRMGQTARIALYQLWRLGTHRRAWR